MALYRTYFERLNFSFTPALRQTADVVFETDIPCDDDHLESFEEAAWNAMWKQNPHWENAEGPIADRPGWSSVLGGSKFEKVS